MARRGGRRRPGLAARLLQWLPVALVVVLLGCAAAAYRFDLGDRWFGADPPDPASEPASVPPPEGVEVPSLARPAAVAAPAAGTLSPGKVRRLLDAGLDDRDLGRSVHAMVAGLDAGTAPVASVGGDPFLPASTMKLLTATAALAALGPDHEFETTVVARGRTLTLVGGGDPLLAGKPPAPGTWPHRADVVTLAKQAAEALRGQQGRHRVRLRYDASLFAGPGENSWWRADYVPDDIVSPISALWVDEGIVGFDRVDDPAAAAAAAFAAALRRQGVDLAGAPSPGRAPRGGEQLAVVSSAPLSQIVERVLLVSDNEGAEVLAHHVGLEVLGDGSFAGGARAVRETLTDLGVPMAGAVIRDGSGLSRHNRLRARTLVEVLRLAAAEDHPELRAVLTGLPVGAFTGSLTYRFDEAPEAGVGRVRAKTGTLTGVSSLAGIATDRSGTPMVFVLAADGVRLRNTLDARQDLDNLAAALGACRCSG